MGVNQALLQLLLLLLSLDISGVFAIHVYTSGNVEAVNGTDVWLKCSFSSSAPIRRSVLTISWSFRPLGPGQEETVFYYHEKPFPPSEGRFQKKVMWAGDVSSRDASIVVRNVKFSYNGTFSCQVKNPPDVHGNVGEVRLRVVTSASFSEIVILAVAIGGAVLLTIIILIAVVSIRRCRKLERMERDGIPRRHKEEPMLW
ncbi:myelin protein zero-like protein 2 [Pygocentrus nattereri]|uniref:myelin protein zero-like protein 2 n=1 Tax=Pygocentrus nattereri TaxID=42514 RepID=UPI0008142CD7|nr:myelin protein zero-like protein 2 [Pygocentrus nattereri]